MILVYDAVVLVCRSFKSLLGPIDFAVPLSRKTSGLSDYESNERHLVISNSEKSPNAGGPFWGLLNLAHWDR